MQSQGLGSTLSCVADTVLYPPTYRLNGLRQTDEQALMSRRQVDRRLATVTWHRSGSQSPARGWMLSMQCRWGRHDELASVSNTALGRTSSVGSARWRSLGRVTGVRAIEMNASWLSWQHSLQSSDSTTSPIYSHTHAHGHYYYYYSIIITRLLYLVSALHLF